MRFTTNLKKSVLTGSSAMNRRRTLSINIRNSIGTTCLRISRTPSVTSMLPQVGVGGLLVSAATCFVPSVTYTFRGHSRSEVSRRAAPRRRMSITTCVGPDVSCWRLCDIARTRLDVGFRASRTLSRRGPRAEFDPHVRSGRALQEDFSEFEGCGGLASMYPAFDWSLCAPGHHGYQRACDLISG